MSERGRPPSWHAWLARVSRLAPSALPLAERIATGPLRLEHLHAGDDARLAVLVERQLATVHRDGGILRARKRERYG